MHKKVNEVSVYLLPKPLFEIYRPHLNYLIEHSVDPDKRRYIVENEGIRHYIDLDAYENLDSIPRSWKDAKAKIGEKELKKHGIIPWSLNILSYRLTKAFEEKDLNKIIYLSAEIGHYVGDLHVPLHTTKNYNGQLSNQYGIHGLWESRIPELFFDDMKFEWGEVSYFSSIQDSIWKAAFESHSLLDSVFSMDSLIRNNIKSNQIFEYDKRGRQLQKNYSIKYSKKYYYKMPQMIESRFQKACVFLASIWYTCWINAGQPSAKILLEGRSKIDQQIDSLNKDSTLQQLWKLKPILGREEPSH